MTFFLHSWRRAGLAPVVVLLALAAGCSSDPGPSRRGGPAMGVRAKPPAPMVGQDIFSTA